MTLTAQEMLAQIYVAHRDSALPAHSSYLASYPALITHFQAIESFTANQFIVAAHLVYGWMPTILTLNFSLLPEALPLLDAARRGGILTAPELALLAGTVNNSVIGASKLLHFTNPSLYPIWDSRVFHFLHGPLRKGHHYQVNQAPLYEAYAHICREVVLAMDFQPTYHLLLEQFKVLPGYQTFTMAPLRALEYIMFMGGGKHESTAQVTEDSSS